MAVTFMLLLLIRRVREVYKEFKRCHYGENGFVILLTIIFVGLLLLTDQWLESSEMFFIILFLYFNKLEQHRLNDSVCL